MATVLITGASGYLGGRLVEMAMERGHEVKVLGTPPTNAPHLPSFSWRLGDEPPLEAFIGVSAVFHLGHSLASDSQQRDAERNINLIGSELLAAKAQAADVHRFVFVSSISAHPHALNAYGRVKFAVEERLSRLSEDRTEFISARLGLVYGGKERALYGLLSRIVKLTPILPMVGLDRKVQPIHIDEVCCGLLTLGLDRVPKSLPPRRFILAAPEPIAFAHWLRLLRRAHTAKSLVLIPVPVRMALIGCGLSKVVPFVPTVDRERVLGLVGTEPVACAADIATLRVVVIDPSLRLASLRSERRRIVGEARALLSYVAGRRITSTAAIGRLVRGIDRLGTGALGLPMMVVGHAALLRFFDPLFPVTKHRLGQRLYLASLVTESMDERVEGKAPSIFAVGCQIVIECLILPFRLVLGRLYA